jgi:iron complex transport system ATP-binding protein
VTHHVEEITPAFAHILLLRQGQVLAAGSKTTVLKAPLLSEAYGHPIRLRQSAGRQILELVE